MKTLLLFLMLSTSFANAAEIKKIPIFSGKGDLIYTDQITINGLPIGITMVDTGASTTFMSTETAKLLGLRKVAVDHEVVVANGKTVKVEVYHAKTIEIGECVVHDAIVMAFPKSMEQVVLGLHPLIEVEPFGFSISGRFMFVMC